MNRCECGRPISPRALRCRAHMRRSTNDGSHNKARERRELLARWELIERDIRAAMMVNG